MDKFQESNRSLDEEKKNVILNEEKMEDTIMRLLPVDNVHSLEASKFAREADKILKLRVTEDAVNWELKERLKSLEATKDHQQQNLVKQQMKYEALEIRLQNELGNRENLINKVSNTRQICTAVESHASSAIEELPRCERSREVLSKGYEAAATAINTVKEESQEFQKRQQQQLRDLENKHAGELKINQATREQCAMQVQLNEQLIEILKNQNELQMDLINVRAMKIEEVTKEKEDIIETLQKEKVLRVNLNNLHTQKIEEATKNNEETKHFLMKKTEEIVSLNAQHALSMENSAQKITDLEVKIKENSIVLLDAEKEIQRINLLLTEVKDNNDKIKKSNEELVGQLGLAEASYKKLSDQKQALETKAKLEMEAKLEERTTLTKKFKESLESLQERYDEASRKSEQSEAEVEKIQRKHEKDMSVLRANLTSVTAELNEEMKKKDASLSSKEDQITGLMSQLEANTEARVNAEKALHQQKQENHIFKELHKEKQATNEKRYNLLSENFEKIRKFYEAKIQECANLIEKNTSLQKDLDSQKTRMAEPKKVPQHKDKKRRPPRPMHPSAHAARSTMDTEQYKPAAPKQKDSDLNLIPLKVSKNKGETRNADMDSFLSDSSFDGFMYDLNAVKQQYNHMMSVSDQPHSTTKPYSDHPTQEKESKIQKKKNETFAFVKNQQNK